VTISENAAETPSVTPHLNKGERYTVKDLLYLALMRSVNSAAVALAEATAGSEEKFVNLMNEKVYKIGLENTRFINASGLPGPEQYITAFDLAIIMKESLRYPTIREIINTKEKEIYSLDGRKLHIKNTNNLLWRNDNILGGKTGYTKAAGHCLVCAEDRDNNLLISVILGETVRDNLWESTSILLSKGSDVLNDKIEPLIYLSNAKSNPVVFASYKTANKDFSEKNKKIVSKKGKKSLNIAKKTTKKTSKILAKKEKKTRNLTVYKRITKKEVKS
jgi:D-alanyl-D-alanine carboxypeptidase (penicillin-binding protein 5/6)